MAIKKRFFRRGPDRRMHESHVAVDDWQPIPGQDIAFVDTIHGAGWLTIHAIRPIYTGSLAHTEMAKLVHGEANQVYLQEIEVFCEEKDFSEYS